MINEIGDLRMYIHNIKPNLNLNFLISLFYNFINEFNSKVLTLKIWICKLLFKFVNYRQ